MRQPTDNIVLALFESYCQTATEEEIHVLLEDIQDVSQFYIYQLLVKRPTPSLTLILKDGNK